jgi:hypothetical protein
MVLAGLFCPKKYLTINGFCNSKEQHETVGVREVRIVGGDSALFWMMFPGRFDHAVPKVCD